MWFSDVHNVQPVPLKFFHLPRSTPRAVKKWAHSLLLPSLGLTTTNPFCLWICLVDISYIRNPTIRDALCLSQSMFSRFSQFMYRMYQYFSVFYGWMLTHFMDLPQFISFVDGPFGCCEPFWLLWIVLLWTFVNKYLFEYFFVVWGI